METPASLSTDDLERSIVPRFEDMAARFPGRDAVTDGSRVVTYADLDRLASGVAAAIRSRTGSGESPIGLALGHNALAVIALMGVLKAGRPYLPMRPADPVPRLLAIVQDAQPALIITSRTFAGRMEALRAQLGGPSILTMEDLDLGGAQAQPGIELPPDSLLCVIYTSGTTGKPKGVARSHRSVVAAALAHVQRAKLGEDDRTAMLSSLSFGGSIPSVLGPLLTGGAVCMFDFVGRGPAQAFAWLQSERVTWLVSTGSVFRAIFEQAPSGLILPDLRMIRLGGERTRGSDFALYKAHTAPHCVFVNGFGSTEAGVISSLVLSHDSVVTDEWLSVGRPAPDTDVLLVDEEGRPVPRGEAGEIVVRSVVAASAYWNSDVTPGRGFYQDPAYPGTTTFHTGDLGRWREDGELEFLGRKDAQVKVRGFRVELSEVESALIADQRIQDAVVIARPARTRPDQNQLIAYVVPASGPPPALTELRELAARSLPDYMVPAYFVILPRLPLNPHGKVDLGALPDVPERAELSVEERPQNELESTLAAVWSSILNLERVGVEDNFFEIGGDSLSVLSMMLEVERAVGRDVSQGFFRAPTIRGLAELLHRSADVPSPPGFRVLGGRRHDSRRDRDRGHLLRRLVGKLRWQASRFRRRVDEAFLFESVVALFARQLTFAGAKALVLKLADRPVLWSAIYRRKTDVYRRFLESLGISPANHELAFQRAFASNMLFKLLEGLQPFGRAGTSRFVNDRRRMIESTPIDSLTEHVHIEGLEHARAAQAAGRGAILLSFHGQHADRAGSHILSRALGGQEIEGIAYGKALRSADYLGRQGQLTTAAAGSIFGELGVYARGLLRQGKFVSVRSDTMAPGPGLTFSLRIGDRQYEIRPGFAELALTTGASILPFHGYFDVQGRLHLALLAPLEAGRGTHGQRIERLVSQFEEFMNSSFRAHPEIQWLKMRNHLRRPRAPALLPDSGAKER